MLAVFTLFCAGAIFYAYFGYPLVLLAVRRERGTHGGNGLERAITVSVVITVRNEAASIAAKLENTLCAADRAVAAGIPINVIVASDASDDGTDKIVEQFASRGVRLVRLAERGGKEQAQLAAIRSSQDTVMVFTDAKVRLEPDAFIVIARHFCDPTVGAVSSIDEVTTPGGEGLYVKYEMWLRKLESKKGSLVGVSGSCFAVRNEIAEQLRPDIPSDFVSVIEAQRLGWRAVLAEDVRCAYASVSSSSEEFERKVRTVLRGITALWTYRGVLNPVRYGFFAFQLLSHKLIRWLVPWLFTGSAIGSLLLTARCELFAVLFLAHLALCIVAAVASGNAAVRDTKIGKIALFFMVSNGAILVAWFRFLAGHRATTWDPSQKKA